MSGSVGWCAARRRRKEGERRVPETAWGAGREEYERGGRGGEAAAPAHHQYGSWVAAPRTATSGAGASAAQRRVQAGASKSRAATDSPRRPAALAPRASRRRESGEVRGACQLDFSSSMAAARAACASGQAACPRACSFRLRPSAPAGPSALAARQLPGKQTAKRRAAPNLHMVVDSRGGCSPAARHGLGIRHELASDAASGRIGRR